MLNFGLFCHSNFACARFHGTEPLYDLFLASHCWGTKAQGLFCHSNFVCTRFHGTEPFARTLSGSALVFRLGSRLRSGTCLASALSAPLVHPLKCHALKRCTFWRETCLASVFALWLANQRARAASRSAKNIVRLVPSQPLLGNKSTRSVLPFKLRLHSFSWNRTIVSHFWVVAYIKNERY